MWKDKTIKPFFYTTILLIFVILGLLGKNYPYGVDPVRFILPFSIIFFISFFEIIPLYKNKILSPVVSLLLMGLSTTLIMQLHLSWVLLMPFALIAFYFLFKEKSGFSSFLP